MSCYVSAYHVILHHKLIIIHTRWHLTHWICAQKAAILKISCDQFLLFSFIQLTVGQDWFECHRTVIIDVYTCPLWVTVTFWQSWNRISHYSLMQQNTQSFSPYRMSSEVRHKVSLSYKSCWAGVISLPLKYAINVRDMHNPSDQLVIRGSSVSVGIGTIRLASHTSMVNSNWTLDCTRYSMWYHFTSTIA